MSNKIRSEHIGLDTTNFVEILSATEDTAQKAFEKIDTHVQSGAYGGTGLTGPYSRGDIAYVPADGYIFSILNRGSSYQVLTIVGQVPTWQTVQATNVDTDTTYFGRILSSADDTVQKAFDTLDRYLPSILDGYLGSAFLDGYATKLELTNYFTKWETGNILDGYVSTAMLDGYATKADLNNYYSKFEIGDILDGYATDIDLLNFYTKLETGDILDGYTPLIELDNYYDKWEVGAIVDGYVNNTTITNYYTKQETGDILDGYALKSDLDGYVPLITLDNYYDKWETGFIIDGYISDTDILNYYTRQETGDILDGYSSLPFKRIATTTPVTVTSTDNILLINMAAPSAVAVNLPNSPIDGQNLVVKDIKGDAFTNNITINRAGGQLIDGQTSVSIISDYGKLTLIYDLANTLWSIIG